MTSEYRMKNDISLCSYLLNWQFYFAFFQYYYYWWTKVPLNILILSSMNWMQTGPRRPQTQSKCELQSGGRWNEKRNRINQEKCCLKLFQLLFSVLPTNYKWRHVLVSSSTAFAIAKKDPKSKEFRRVTSDGKSPDELLRIAINRFDCTRTDDGVPSSMLLFPSHLSWIHD